MVGSHTRKGCSQTSIVSASATLPPAERTFEKSPVIIVVSGLKVLVSEWKE